VTPSSVSLVKSIARLPLRQRRLALRIIWKVSLARRKDVGFGLEPFLAKRLRVGAAEARRLALEHDFHDHLQILEWFATGTRSDAQLETDSRLINVREPGLAERIADGGQTVILAPLHMGMYPMGITYVVWRFFRGRRVLVLRAREDVEENNVAMERLRAVASELMLLNTRAESDFMEAMRFARKGAVVISLIDLPQSYGSPADTTLFGEPASIALGIETMARMLKSVVLPMAVISRIHGDDVAFGEPFEVWQSSREERSALALRIGRQIERFVRLAPEQWHMWTRIDEFDPRNAEEDTLATTNERTSVDAPA
jgi:lauroyl/myristoyl acyltransferase